MAAVRILHLHSSFDLGGKEARAVQLMNHFGNQAEHTIISAVPDAVGARAAIDKRIKVEFPGEDAPALHGRPGILRYRKLAQYMKRFHLVLSYNWGAMDGVMARTMLSATMKLPPLIHHEDGFNEDEADRLNWKRNLFRAVALQRSYALVVPSLTLERVAMKDWHQQVDHIRRIPNGVQSRKYVKNAQRGAFPGFVRREGDIIVGTIAGLRPVKNLPRLVRAVAAAGPNVRLAIAGEGPDRGAIMAEAERLGIADRLMMPGFLRDPSRYVGLFDIFALSSDSEQFPISLVEAMAAHRPAVSTDVGDVKNMVSTQNKPFVVARDDEAGLAEAIKTLAGDSRLRQQIGEENARRAHNEYDEELMFARYRQLYGGAMRRAEFARQA